MSAIHIKKSHRGLLHKDLSVAKGKKIPVSMLEQATHSTDPHKRARAQFALNARKWHH